MAEPVSIRLARMERVARLLAGAGLTPGQEPLISVAGYGSDVQAFCLVRAPFGHHACCPWVQLLDGLGQDAPPHDAAGAGTGE